jgi:hypothetical protein
MNSTVRQSEVFRIAGRFIALPCPYSSQNLLFNPDAGDTVFLRKHGILVTGYVALYRVFHDFRA